MHYRPEIDGLRAVAVVPVILFHSGLFPVGGGFVGVDVFFVISGYLITTLLIEDLTAGRFSLLDFYERRARRILPALFLVMAVSAGLAWVTLMPDDMARFSRSVAATALFSSNLLFWKESGYFDAASELKPLLHTWSLAIEEQFYILFPLVLMVFWRRARRWLVPTLGLVFVISFGLAQWGAIHKPSSAFFLLPTRAWELGIGVACALWLRRMPRPAGMFAQFGSALGLGLIALSVILFDDHTLWPGLPALIPTMGTALVILCARPGTLVGALLGTRVLVGLGLISYSAYLWHQPLFAFARYRSLSPLPDTTMALLCLLVFALAWVSWKYVERPFRSRAVHARPAILAASAAGLVAFVGLGLAGHATKGFPEARIPAPVARIAAFAHDDNPLRENCFSGPGSYVAPDQSCILGDPGSLRGVLLGDSHSDAVAYPIHTGLLDKGIGIRHMWYNGCPPMRGIHVLGHGRNYRCAEFNNAVFDTITQDPALEYVVLTGRFTIYYDGEGYDNGEGGIEHDTRYPAGRVGHQGPYSETQRRADVLAHYAKGVGGKSVILVYPVPEQGWDVPVHMAKNLLYSGKIEDISVDFASYKARNHPVTEAFDALGNHPKLHRVRPADVLCDTFVKGRCAGSLDSTPLYYDDDHLSNTGAELLAPDILRHIPAHVAEAPHRDAALTLPDAGN